MHGRRPFAIVLAIAGLTGAAAVGPTASADAKAKGLEEVALVDIPEVSHFDWFTRTVDGQTRVIAMVGSRDMTPKPGGVIVDDQPAGGLNLVDVTDPENPEFLLNVWCATANNDVAYVDAQHTINGVAYDGFIALASNDTFGCAQNGTDPRMRGAVSVIGLRAIPAAGQAVTADWFRSPFIEPTPTQPLRPFSWGGRNPAAHTVVAHPVEPIVYVGNQNLADREPSVEILDFRTWPPVGKSHLLVTQVAPGRTVPQTALVGPHDITFSPDGTRAFASAIDASYIFDTSGSKLFAPEPIATLLAPNLKIHHETVLHPNGRHLLTVDEFIATSNENIPVCPGGGIHVFDLGPLREDGTRAFESAPVPVGQFYADELGTLVPFGVEVDPDNRRVRPDLRISCTAHEFDIPASGEWMPLAWFGAGVRILDLSMLVDPAVLASPVPTPIGITESGYFLAEGNDVWAARQHPLVPGYVFATDTEQGFRILKRVPAS